MDKTEIKMSEITIENVKTYLVLEEGDTDEQDNNLLSMFLASAKSYILNFTGLTTKEADEKLDLAYATLVVTASMYEDRELYRKDDDLSKLLEHILGMHSINLLV